MLHFLDSLNRDEADKMTPDTSCVNEQEWQALLNQFISHVDGEKLLELETGIAGDPVTYCRRELNKPVCELTELEKLFSCVTIPEFPVETESYVRHLGEDVFQSGRPRLLARFCWPHDICPSQPFTCTQQNIDGIKSKSGQIRDITCFNRTGTSGAGHDAQAGLSP